MKYSRSASETGRPLPGFLALTLFVCLVAFAAWLTKTAWNASVPQASGGNLGRFSSVWQVIALWFVVTVISGWVGAAQAATRHGDDCHCSSCGGAPGAM